MLKNDVEYFKNKLFKAIGCSIYEQVRRSDKIKRIIEKKNMVQ